MGKGGGKAKGKGAPSGGLQPPGHCSIAADSVAASIAGSKGGKGGKGGNAGFPQPPPQGIAQPLPPWLGAPGPSLAGGFNPFMPMMPNLAMGMPNVGMGVPVPMGMPPLAMVPPPMSMGMPTPMPLQMPMPMPTQAPASTSPWQKAPPQQQPPAAAEPRKIIVRSPKKEKSKKDRPGSGDTDVPDASKDNKLKLPPDFKYPKAVRNREVEIVQLEVPVAPEELDDGGRQVLLNVGPLTKSNEKRTICFKEFGVSLPIPEWYKEAEEFMEHPEPPWPPVAVTSRRSSLPTESSSPKAFSQEASMLRTSSLSGGPRKVRFEVEDLPMLSESDDDSSQRSETGVIDTVQDLEAFDYLVKAKAEQDKQNEEPQQVNMRSRRLFKVFLAAIFTIHVEQAGLRSMLDWAKRMQLHFEASAQVQLRSSISWLSRSLRTFGRTLIQDSQKHLELNPEALEGNFSCFTAESELGARERLAIRTHVVLEVMESEIDPPPLPLANFLSNLAQPEGVMLFVPQSYLTPREQSALDYDALRGGIYATIASEKQQMLIAGFLFARALLAGLFASWSHTLDLDGSPASQRAKANLQAIGALIFLAMQHRYPILDTVNDVPGVRLATSDRVGRFGIDKPLIEEVAEKVESVVMSFVDLTRRVPVELRHQSLAFVAGSVSVKEGRNRKSRLSPLMGLFPRSARVRPTEQDDEEDEKDEDEDEDPEVKQKDIVEDQTKADDEEDIEAQQDAPVGKRKSVIEKMQDAAARARGHAQTARSRFKNAVSFVPR